MKKYGSTWIWNLDKTVKINHNDQRILISKISFFNEDKLFRCLCQRKPYFDTGEIMLNGVTYFASVFGVPVIERNELVAIKGEVDLKAAVRPSFAVLAVAANR